jgi:hypothetical protein
MSSIVASVAAVESDRFTCQICRNYSAQNFPRVLSHIGAVHSHEAGFFLTCGFENCVKTYSNYYSFRRHLKSRHPHILRDGCPSVMPGQNDQHEEIIDINLEDVSAEEEIISPQTSSSISMRNSALFILKLKEIHKVSQSAVNDIIQEITAFTQQGIEEIKFKLFSTLSDMPNPGVDEIFLNSLLNDPFIGLTSEYLQNKYFEENLKLVVSFCLH